MRHRHAVCQWRSCEGWRSSVIGWQRSNVTSQRSGGGWRRNDVRLRYSVVNRRARRRTPVSQPCIRQLCTAFRTRRSSSPCGVVVAFASRGPVIDEALAFGASCPRLGRDPRCDRRGDDARRRRGGNWRLHHVVKFAVRLINSIEEAENTVNMTKSSACEGLGQCVAAKWANENHVNRRGLVASFALTQSEPTSSRLRMLMRMTYNHSIEIRLRKVYLVSGLAAEAILGNRSV